jgi:mycothiol synthase
VRLLTAADWSAFLSLPFNRDGRDFGLALEEGRIAGVLTSTRIPAAGASPDRRHFRIVVHPEFRRRGVGSALLRLVESQDPGDPPAVFQCRIPGTWTDAASFFGKRGFRAVQTDVEMERGGPPPPEPPLPSGVAIREAAPGPDDADLLRLHDEGFAEDFGFVPATPEFLAAERAMAGAWYGVAIAEGRVAGYCKTHHEGESTGWLHALVVAAPFRGRGIGRALLLRALARLHAEGRRKTGLVTEDRNAAALALYRSAGFTVAEEEVAWWREA